MSEKGEKKVKVEVELMRPLSVTRSVDQVVGSCEVCGESALLAWESAELGDLCRDCANSIIETELGELFPTARWVEKRLND